MTPERIGSDYEGNNKWCGIVKGRDNCFYCLPSDAKQILKIDPFNDETTLVGEECGDVEKWFSGFAHGDLIYGIPYSANRFLKYNVKTGTFELVGDDFEDGFGMKWMSGENITFIGDDYKGEFKQEGGVEEMDDNIYGVPYEHNKWLKIDIVTDSTSLVGDDLSKYRECKYNGGVVGQVTIYC